MTESDPTRTKNVGIWIDHKEAILVFVEDDQATVEHIESNAESHFRPSSGGKASGSSAVAVSVAKEQKAEERRKHQYRNFYKQVIQQCGQPGALYIFGPGEAKLELAKEIEKLKSHQYSILAVETSDKLTQNQLVQKVKAFF